MKPYSHKRYTLLASVLLVVGGLLLACFLWVRAEQRQYTMNRQLIDSLQQGDVNRALKLVEQGADPNTRVIPLPAPTWQELLAQLFHRSKPSSNNSPTAFMVVCGDYLVTVSHQSRPIIPRNTLYNPVLLAVAQAMLIHGANVNARDESGWTALMAAASNRLTDRMSLLLEHHALIDVPNNGGGTALHFAVMEHDPEAVKLLLKYHANSNLRNNKGATPMDICNQMGYPPTDEIIRLLKAAGATK